MSEPSFGDTFYISTMLTLLAVLVVALVAALVAMIGEVVHLAGEGIASFASSNPAAFTALAISLLAALFAVIFSVLYCSTRSCGTEGGDEE